MSRASSVVRLKACAKVLHLIVVMGGILVFLGWTFDSPTLKRIHPNLVAMNPMAALCFILAGSAGWLSVMEDDGRWARRAIPLLAATVVVVAFVKIIGHVAGFDHGIDTALFAERLDREPLPNRMARNTAFSFLCVGLALLLLEVETRTGRRPAELAVFFVLLVALFVLTGYAYRVTQVAAVGQFTPMALHTAFGFALLSLGILFSRPDRGLMAALTADGLGSDVARRLLPAAIVAPFVLGWLRLLGERADIYHTELGAALMAVSAIVLLSAVIWWNAAVLNRADAERKEARNEMRHANEFLDSIVENIPSMIFVKDAAELRFVRFNKAGEELLGCSREELIGRSDHDLFPKEQAEYFVAKDRSVLADRKPLDVPEETVDTRSNGVRILHTKKVALLDDEGNAQYLLGISEDITERKSAEEERDRLFTLSPNLMCIADLDGWFKRLNPTWEKLLGFTRQELMAEPFLHFVHPDDREATIAEVAKLSSGAQTLDFENRYRCKDGSYLWVLWAAVAVPNDRVIYASGSDVSERKRIEEEVRRARETAESANNELEAFSYSVSHDLRAPLRSIDGFSLALAEDWGAALNDECKGHLERIRGATRRMAQLIDDLLNLSRVSRAQLVRAPVDLSAMAESVLSELRATEPERDVEVVVAPQLVVDGDPRLLAVVLQNLLANAWKFTAKQPRGRIEFGVTEEGGRRVYFVRDDGAGFDMAYAGKLFGAFQRLHDTAEFPGTGVGLATVQRIIHRHGGRIWAEGAVGKGASFYFTL
jgi:PAS domain S-box-containing protein